MPNAYNGRFFVFMGYTHSKQTAFPLLEDS